MEEKLENSEEQIVGRKNKVSVLKGIDESYYPQIFNIINNTIVLGNKKKFNTLEYLENQIMISDVKKVKELGFPVNDIEKAHIIKGILIKFIEMSKEIRRDQWMTADNPKKQEPFEARKHSTQEAIVDRNIRLMRKLHVGKETAARFGVALSLEDLKRFGTDADKAKNLVAKAKKDPAFNSFYENFKAIYKLGEPTSESDDVLYKVYEDLKNSQGENSFGLKGTSLKAAISLVEETIKTRRNTHNRGVKASKHAIEEEQRDLGM